MLFMGMNIIELKAVARTAADDEEYYPVVTN